MSKRFYFLLWLLLRILNLLLSLTNQIIKNVFRGCLSVRPVGAIALFWFGASKPMCIQSLQRPKCILSSDQRPPILRGPDGYWSRVALRATKILVSKMPCYFFFLFYIQPGGPGLVHVSVEHWSDAQSEGLYWSPRFIYTFIYPVFFFFNFKYFSLKYQCNQKQITQIVNFLNSYVQLNVTHTSQHNLRMQINTNSNFGW